VVQQDVGQHRDRIAVRGKPGQRTGNGIEHGMFVMRVAVVAEVLSQLDERGVRRRKHREIGIVGGQRPDEIGGGHCLEQNVEIIGSRYETGDCGQRFPV